MKISKEAKQKTRIKIIESTAVLIAENGFKETSLREIAQAAGIADPTIYKYFSSKEAIVYAFFEYRIDQTIERLTEIEEFNTYSFQEQFHVVLETLFEVLESDRKFITTTSKHIFLTNWMSASEGIREARKKFTDVINELIEAAVEVEEFPEPPFASYVNEILWEYSVGIAYYWLYDTSDNYQNTTQMIDKSLALIVATLSSDILGRLADLLQFILREHVLSLINSNRKGTPFDLNKIKRKFMSKT